MKLVSSDFSQNDIQALKDWLRTVQTQDKTMTMKKYVKFCVVEMTNTLVQMRAKELQDAANRAKSLDDSGATSAVQVGEVNNSN